MPPEIDPLALGTSAEAATEREAKVQQRNQQVQEINERNNSVWCHIALALDKTSLMYSRHDCMSPDRMGDGAKAWRLLQQRYSNVEKPTVVSLVVDTGCTYHVVNQKNVFENLRPCMYCN